MPHSSFVLAAYFFFLFNSPPSAGMVACVPATTRPFFPPESAGLPISLFPLCHRLSLSRLLVFFYFFSSTPFTILYFHLTSSALSELEGFKARSSPFSGLPIPSRNPPLLLCDLALYLDSFTAKLQQFHAKQAAGRIG